MNFLLCVLVTLSLALTTAGAFAQVPDTILLDGRIVTADEGSTVHQALAVREGRIVALGQSAEIKRFAGKETRVADLGGRTVIPGLIDSHMHAIRAALSYTTEVHWFGTASIEAALGRWRDAAFACRSHIARHALAGNWPLMSR
jgi:predicted amidohydrolase YtcJ